METIPDVKQFEIKITSAQRYEGLLGEMISVKSVNDKIKVIWPEKESKLMEFIRIWYNESALVLDYCGFIQGDNSSKSVVKEKNTIKYKEIKGEKTVTFSSVEESDITFGEAGMFLPTLRKKTGAYLMLWREFEQCVNDVATKTVNNGMDNFLKLLAEKLKSLSKELINPILESNVVVMVKKEEEATVTKMSFGE